MPPQRSTHVTQKLPYWVLLRCRCRLSYCGACLLVMEIASRIPFDSSYSSYEIVDPQLLTLWLVNGTSSFHREQRRFLHTALCSLNAYPFRHARRGCIYSTSDDCMSIASYQLRQIPSLESPDVQFLSVLDRTLRAHHLHVGRPFAYLLERADEWLLCSCPRSSRGLLRRGTLRKLSRFPSSQCT